MGKFWLYPMTPSVTGVLTTAQMFEMGKKFEEVTDDKSLAKLLKTSDLTLRKWAAKPQYISFEIPKPGGAKRQIQTPVAELKDLQQRLNLYLQCSYSYLKPAAAFGFIMNAVDEQRIRNIYANALQHIGSQWVWNLDLKDFFPNINSQMLTKTITNILGFPKQLTALLVNLCTSRGRLPMGSPTSPILSNLVCLDLDLKLQNIAKAYDAIYTRYADDMTFSFETKPTAESMLAIRQIIETNGFIINENKVTLTPMSKLPQVTGLVLQPTKPDISREFFKDLKREIKIYQWMVADENLHRGVFNEKSLDKFHKSVMGQINFVGFVRGKTDKKYTRLLDLLNYQAEE
jgi:RNA-directed DNA polymerase